MEHTEDAKIQERIRSISQWYHRIEVRPGTVTPGINDCATTLQLLNPPPDCRGLRVLDIGTRDGFFAFQFEARGAEVVAVDYVPKDQTGFGVAAELLQSRVAYVQDNIYSLSTERYGTFDIVLLLGLIYHLPDPLLALSIARRLCRERLYLETQVTDHAFRMPDGRFVPLEEVAKELVGIPLMQFYPSGSLNNDPTNYWAPNVICMEMMLIESNFMVLNKGTFGQRAFFECRTSGDEERTYQSQIARGLVP